jgi:hypothetical protein
MRVRARARACVWTHQHSFFTQLLHNGADCAKLVNNRFIHKAYYADFFKQVLFYEDSVEIGQNGVVTYLTNF